MMEFDFGLGETLDMLRASVQRFARDEIAPLAVETDRSNEFPRGAMAKTGCARRAGYYRGRTVRRC